MYWWRVSGSYRKLLLSSKDQLCLLVSVWVCCCRFVIAAVCVCRGDVISKAGPEEAVIYADIGECLFLRNPGVSDWIWFHRESLYRCVCVPLCIHPLWSVPRPAVLSRHPAADPDHGPASGRPLHGGVCAGGIELSERRSEGTDANISDASESSSLPRSTRRDCLNCGDAVWMVVDSPTAACLARVASSGWSCGLFCVISAPQVSS